MIEPSLQIGGGNWANKSDSLLGYHKDGANFYADELTFSRNSLGSYTDANGLIQSMPYNLVGYSEEFNNAAWNKTGGASVTANDTTAPNGTLTADKISFSAYAHELFNNAQYNITGVYTHTFYAKGTAGQIFNYYDGVGDTAITLTADWVRYTVTRTYSNQTLIMNFNSYGSWTASNFFLWGAQLNSGSTALPYFPTTTRLNLARVDYKDNVNGSLLLEPQRTNLFTYSEQFDNAYWSKTGATITANTTTSPDGYVNADTLVENSSTAIHAVFQNAGVTIAVGTATFSVFVKPNGRNFFQIRTGSAAGITNAPLYANFDLVDDLVTAQSVGANSAKIESYSNGWKRCSVSFTITSGATVALVYQPITSGTAVIAESYAGDGTSGVFLWGAQLEAGSYSTSYIKSEGASTTRLADSCSKTGISDKIGDSEGWIYGEVEGLTNTYGTTSTILSVSDGTTDNRVQFSFNASTNFVTPRIFVGGSSIYAVDIGLTITNKFKFAIQYSGSTAVCYINGTLAHSTSGLSFFADGTLSKVSFNQGDGSAIGYGKISQIIIGQSALTNDELATLTTL